VNDFIIKFMRFWLNLLYGENRPCVPKYDIENFSEWDDYADELNTKIVSDFFDNLENYPRMSGNYLNMIDKIYPVSYYRNDIRFYYSKFPKVSNNVWHLYGLLKSTHGWVCHETNPQCDLPTPLTKYYFTHEKLNGMVISMEEIMDRADLWYTVFQPMYEVLEDYEYIILRSVMYNTLNTVIAEYTANSVKNKRRDEFDRHFSNEFI